MDLEIILMESMISRTPQEDKNLPNQCYSQQVGELELEEMWETAFFLRFERLVVCYLALLVMEGEQRESRLALLVLSASERIMEGGGVQHGQAECKGGVEGLYLNSGMMALCHL